IDVETQTRHAGDAGGQRDEGADDGKQASEKDGGVAPALEEAVGVLEVAGSEQDVTAVALHQPSPAEVADLVGDHRSQVAAEGAGGGGPEQAEAPLADQV